MIRIGIIGYGYWGKNIARNFSTSSHFEVVAISDLSEANLNGAKKLYPNVNLIKDYKDIIASPDIDAVAVITPVETHYEISKLVLESGKHLFVEKPFTQHSYQAEELIALAEKKSLIILLDHTFIYTEAVRKIKELVEEKTLGDILYYDATRVNLGLFRQDVNVIWDLAPHDFSIMSYLIGQRPQALSAHGMDHYKKNLYNTAYITVYFDNLIAHFNFNWLSPVKIRTTYIGGDKKMIVWDDMENDEKVKVFDKGITIDDNRNRLSNRIGYRMGDIWIPHLDPKEALSNEADHFADCILHGAKPITDGLSGLQIVKFLEATDFSIKNQGKIVNL